MIITILNYDNIYKSINEWLEDDLISKEEYEEYKEDLKYFKNFEKNKIAENIDYYEFNINTLEEYQDFLVHLEKWQSDYNILNGIQTIYIE